MLIFSGIGFPALPARFIIQWMWSLPTLAKITHTNIQITNTQAHAQTHQHPHTHTHTHTHTLTNAHKQIFSHTLVCCNDNKRNNILRH